MHRIECLEVLGFKSFYEKTHLVFDNEVTAIIGPNGCGKSNLSDAISWVLGEQSIKSLRADRMEDVIFNGTQYQKPLGFTEVTLALKAIGNDDADFEHEGVSISRRLYRSGESDYFLNGRRCRLKDIHEFFEGTGLGAVSYALIEQGKIDMILSSKPQDRRALIEEAAKITLFKTKRRASEVKLELARQNLARVNDIIQEVERQLAALKRQAAKARRYYRLQDELKHFSQINFRHEHETLTSSIKNCQAAYDRVSLQEKTLAGYLQAAEENRSRILDEINELDRVIGKTSGELSGLALESDRLTNQRSYQAEQLQVLQKQLQTGEAGDEEALRRLDSIRFEIAKTKETLDRFEREIAQKETEADPLRDRTEQTHRTVESMEAELQTLRASAVNEVGQVAELKNQKVRSIEHLDRLGFHTKRLEQERSKLAVELSGLELQGEHFKAALAENEASSQRLKTRLAEEDQRASDLKTQERIQEEALQEIHDEFNMLQNRLSALEEIERKRSSYSEGVQRFLSSASSLDIKIRGTLADFVDVDPDFESIVEDFLGDRLQYILVDDLEDALKAIRHLESIQAGRCTFLILNTNGSGPKSAFERSEHTLEPETIGDLGDVLLIDSKIQTVLMRSFPELASAVLVPDLATALKLAEKNPSLVFLTPNGEILSGKGMISSCGDKKSNAGLLSIKREKKELSAKIQDYRTRTERAKGALTAIKNHIQDNSISRREAAEQLHKLEVESTGLRLQQQQVEMESERLIKAQETISSEISRCLNEKESIEKQQLELQVTLDSIERECKTKTDRSKALEVDLASLKAERDRNQNLLSEIRLEIIAKRERGQALREETQRLRDYEEELQTREEKIQLQLEDMKQRIGTLLSSNDDIKLKIDELSVRRKAFEEDLAHNQSRLASAKARVTQIEDQLSSTRKNRQLAMEERSKVEIEKARFENDLYHLQRRCTEEFHEPLEGLVGNLTAEQLDYAPELAQQNYQRVKEKLQAIGAINMRALEEYQELEVRHQFLLSQRSDILDSIATTEQAIAEVNRRSKAQFKEAYEKINENFHRIFTGLFGGGRAEMKLLDDTDLLESGIEIIVEPPGKKLQNMLLLSGGEKALAALALLLAVFKFRPSPFCVLDEVDAPLDDANIGRFTRLITDMSRETQFILITHNKRTMEVAKYLYGVTMEQPGISKIVSVKFEREAEKSQRQESRLTSEQAEKPKNQEPVKTRSQGASN